MTTSKPQLFTIRADTPEEFHAMLGVLVAPLLGGTVIGWGHSDNTETLYLVIECQNGRIVDISVPVGTGGSDDKEN